jgi:hypothetical protein
VTVRKKEKEKVIIEKIGKVICFKKLNSRIDNN